MFAYTGCEGRGSVDLDLCLPIDSMNAIENNFKKKFNFDLKVIHFRP